ncbi:hypothetical protein [Ferrimonas balearica]|uniref:hypothetical protein n=1 Tax=Ferrimonas balearica TaxID=44012 RepID=UPI001C0A8FCC|nr:hypothetical protein [Ferrimonas balearica]
MNGAIHTTTAQQRWVGGIDDGIDIQLGNIAQMQLYGHDSLLISKDSVSRTQEHRGRFRGGIEGD